MTKTIIIISVIVLAYLGFWYFSIQESHDIPDQAAQETKEVEESDDTAKEVEKLDDSINKSDGPASPNTPKKSDSNTLDLSSQGLTKLPDYVLAMTELTDLNLSDNALTGALPAEIRHLQNLEKLDVSNNQMTGIPAEIGQLSNLKELNYSNNQITGLPLEIGNLDNLEVFNLSGNDHAQVDLDQIIGNLPNLKVVKE